MDNSCTESLLFSYSDIFFSYYFNDDTSCSHMAKNHAMTYVYSGEMVLVDKERETIVRKGECAFIKRDHKVIINKKPVNGEQYQGIFMMFTRQFLREFYQKLDSANIPENAMKLRENFLKLPKMPEIESLFSSMVPYFDPDIKPKDEFMRLKLIEGVYTLLSIDQRYYPTLFDFTEPWKIDILDFLNENYMYDLSMEDIATFTGRSLATFKRDFKKISELSPQKWLIRKRLEAAYEKIHNNGRKVSDVYMEVGFKNMSHFSTAFKKQFGLSPKHI